MPKEQAPKEVKIRIQYPEEYDVAPATFTTADATEAATWLANSLANWIIDDEIAIEINDEIVWPR
jgi:hypothetical protein